MVSSTLRCEETVSVDYGVDGERVVDCGAAALRCADCGQSAGCHEHALVCPNCGQPVCQYCGEDHACGIRELNHAA